MFRAPILRGAAVWVGGGCTEGDCACGVAGFLGGKGLARGFSGMSVQEEIIYRRKRNIQIEQ